MKTPVRTFVAAALVCASGLTALPTICRAEGQSVEDEQYQKSFDAAIDKALAYLARSQLPDGSFPGGMQKNTAVASLCVMAFLARGHTPGVPPYGETINRSIDFVMGVQAPDGTIIGQGGGQMYAHNISTLMLSEISGMVDPARQKKVKDVLARALKVILDAQRINKPEPQKGGWRYAPNSTDSDLSHSGWALLALRAARNNGAAVPKEAIDEAAGFILKCKCPDGGFAYQPGGGSGLARTGAGLLCLELTGHHRDETTLAAGALILKRFKDGWSSETYYYGMYYCAQGMFQLGEEQWKTFAPQLYEALLKLQTDEGSWPNAPGGQNEDSPGPCYRTAMAVLALGVTYCQLPIYQR